MVVGVKGMNLFVFYLVFGDWVDEGIMVDFFIYSNVFVIYRSV